MAPGLLVGDTVLVDKLAYRSRPPDRGDVIVFQRPGDENASVKRVIGLPGERVELRNNAVLVNGRELRRVTIGDVTFDQSGVVIHRPVELPERTLFEESDGGRRWQVVQLRQTPPQSGAWTVPSESVFVLGDNRDASQDSRVPGAAPVRLTDVVGRVDRVMFSRATTGFRSRWWGPVR
jgi:signal peptidase I